jgi:hypothetical protein
MKQNSNDSNTPFDVHQPGAKDTAPLPADGWRGRVGVLNRRLRELPVSTLVGLATVGGALAVIVLSSGARLLVPAPRTKDPARAVAVAHKKPVADARVYVVPEDEVAPLPAVQPGLSSASLNETRNAEVTSADTSSEASADIEVMRRRRMEDQLAAERQRLEDRKRVIERELENKEIENKRLQEDKAIEEQRRQERQRLLEERQQEEKRLADEAKQETERRLDEQRRMDEEAKREEEKMAAAG